MARLERFNDSAARRAAWAAGTAALRESRAPTAQAGATARQQMLADLVQSALALGLDGGAALHFAAGRDADLAEVRRAVLAVGTPLAEARRPAPSADAAAEAQLAEAFQGLGMDPQAAAIAAAGRR